MTLLRRAHREVYRVYSEEEFFACVDHDGRSERAGAAGERRMHRVAGVTVLLAATGAVGGLIAVTSLSTAMGARRRAGASLLAATRSLMPTQATHVRVWRESPGVDGFRRPSVHALRVARNTTRVMLLRRERAPRGAAAARHVAVANATGTVAVREQDTPIAATTPVQSVRAVASTAATSQPSGQEFGFER
jgi:hypothetical protein